MNIRNATSRLNRLSGMTLGALSLASISSAQATFSIDWHSPTVGMLDSINGVPITEGDILVPAAFIPAPGPLPAPGTLFSGGPGGLGLIGHPPCVGHPGGTPCRVEVDALSYGTDHTMDPFANLVGDYLFSTDEFAIALVPPFLPPSITTEAPFGDASADVWITGGSVPPGPIPPMAFPVGHTGFIDGDGMPSGSGAAYPGTGLLEPNFPGFPNNGDNLDALDFDPNGPFDQMPPGGVYFSLDAVFPDPTGTPNSGSAVFHGFMGSDVLWTPFPGGAPALYAPGATLGLNLVNFQEDDLDALALGENGVPGYQPSLQPNDWSSGATDMLLFSVRRGSPVIGMPDSIFGIPIMEGDILTTPLPAALGGVSPFPGIFCAAENIGLSTLRSGNSSDDLNALDTVKHTTTITDCNGNGIDDAIDISSTTSTDVNTNGIPDECEVVGAPGCFCVAAVAPCGNSFPSAGCRNSTGSGALLTVAGSSSVTLDNLTLSASAMPAVVPGIFFGGTVPVGPLPFGDGLRCAGGMITRFTSPAFTSATGTMSAGPGLAGAFGITSGTTLIFQCWFRDAGGPCGVGFNTTNAYSVIFTP